MSARRGGVLVERAPEMEDHRLLPPALAAWAGAWMGTSLPAGHPIPLMACAVALALALASAGGLLRVALRARVLPPPGRHALTPSGSVRAGLLLASSSLLLALVLGGAARLEFAASPAVIAAQEGRLVTLIGVLEDDPAPSGGESGATSAVLVVGGVRGAVSASPSVKVLLSGRQWPQVLRSDRLRVRGVIDPSFPGGPPFAGTMTTTGVRLLERPGGPLGAARMIRASLVEVASGLDEQGRALVPGMAIGDDRAMGEELEKAFRTSSLVHLTAVSGSHLAIVLGFVAIVAPPSKFGRALVLVSVLSAFVVLVGAGPAVLRAAATAGAGILGSLIGRNGHGVASLSAVVLAALLLDPWCARDFGFALSAAATYGVLVPARVLSAWGRERLREETRPGRAARWALDLAAVPLACSLMSAPILLLLDPGLPTYAVPANIVASPAVAPATVLALLAALLAPTAPGPALVLAQASAVATGWIARTALVFASLPGARAPAGAIALPVACACVVAGMSAKRRLGR